MCFFSDPTGESNREEKGMDSRPGQTTKKRYDDQGDTAVKTHVAAYYRLSANKGP